MGSREILRRSLQDEHTVLATDTVDHLWQAFRARVTDRGWLYVDCGLGGARAECARMPEFTREKRLRTRSANGTLALGEMMTELLRPPKLVLLRGDLGAGKTTLVKGIVSSLGAADAGRRNESDVHAGARVQRGAS